MKIECTIDDIHDRGHLKIQNYESIDVGKSVESFNGGGKMYGEAKKSESRDR